MSKRQRHRRRRTPSMTSWLHGFHFTTSPISNNAFAPVQDRSKSLRLPAHFERHGRRRESNGIQRTCHHERSGDWQGGGPHRLPRHLPRHSLDSEGSRGTAGRTRLYSAAPSSPSSLQFTSLIPRGGFQVAFPRNVPTRNRSTAHYHACPRPIKPQRRRRAQLSASAALSSSSASQASAQLSLVECCTRHQDDSLNDDIIVLRRVLTERCPAPAPRPTLAAHSPA